MNPPRSYLDERIAERRRRALSGAVAAAALAATAFLVLLSDNAPAEAPATTVSYAAPRP